MASARESEMKLTNKTSVSVWKDGEFIMRCVLRNALYYRAMNKGVTIYYGSFLYQVVPEGIEYLPGE